MFSDYMYAVTTMLACQSGAISPGHQEVSLTYQSEQFENNCVKVILEWTQESSFYRYNFIVVPQLELMLGDTQTLHLTVPYNTPYNVSVIATHPCGENSVIAFIELYYGECLSLLLITGVVQREFIVSGNCGNPVAQVNNFTTVIGYKDPAVEGANVTFTCLPGLVLTGPNTTTCMENGEWEPDPIEVNCTGE